MEERRKIYNWTAPELIRKAVTDKAEPTPLPCTILLTPPPHLTIYGKMTNHESSEKSSNLDSEKLRSPPPVAYVPLVMPYAGAPSFFDGQNVTGFLDRVSSAQITTFQNRKDLSPAVVSDRVCRL